MKRLGFRERRCLSSQGQYVEMVGFELMSTWLQNLRFRDQAIKGAKSELGVAGQGDGRREPLETRQLRRDLTIATERRTGSKKGRYLEGRFQIVEFYWDFSHNSIRQWVKVTAMLLSPSKKNFPTAAPAERGYFLNRDNHGLLFAALLSHWSDQKQTPDSEQSDLTMGNSRLKVLQLKYHLLLQHANPNLYDGSDLI